MKKITLMILLASACGDNTREPQPEPPPVVRPNPPTPLPDACADDDGCRRREHCYAGYCTEHCFSEDECPEGTECVVVSSVHAPVCTPTCTSDSQCTESQYCASGVCLSQEDACSVEVH